jgi:hypothetical protein
MADDEKKIDATVSAEEVAAAKAEIAAEAGDDYGDEAVDGDTAASAGVKAGEFEVTKEEMSVIRAELACEFPEDYEYLR